MALEAVLGTCWETGVGLKAGPGRGLGVATERRAKQEGGTGTMGSLACTRLSCRDQEGRRGSEEAVPGPSVFPSGEPGVSGDFWARRLPIPAARGPLNLLRA